MLTPKSFSDVLCTPSCVAGQWRDKWRRVSNRLHHQHQQWQQDVALHHLLTRHMFSWVLVERRTGVDTILLTYFSVFSKQIAFGKKFRHRSFEWLLRGLEILHCVKFVCQPEVLWIMKNFRIWEMWIIMCFYKYHHVMKTEEHKFVSKKIA